MGGPRYGLPIFWCHRRVGSMASYQEFAVVDWASRLDTCKSGGSVVYLSSDRERHETL
jgi:hypothetical protein